LAMTIVYAPPSCARRISAACSSAPLGASSPAATSSEPTPPAITAIRTTSRIDLILVFIVSPCAAALAQRSPRHSGCLMEKQRYSADTTKCDWRMLALSPTKMAFAFLLVSMLRSNSPFSSRGHGEAKLSRPSGRVFILNAVCLRSSRDPVSPSSIFAQIRVWRRCRRDLDRPGKIALACLRVVEMRQVWPSRQTNPSCSRQSSCLP